LSDGTYGFVISVPNKNVLKPQVVVVRNASNQDLTKQYLIDLQIELDITISQDIDVNEIYGDKALEIFTNLSVS
jgi:hypothetical protein